MLKNLSNSDGVILAEVFNREQFGELAPLGVGLPAFAEDIKTYLLRIDAFIEHHKQQGWELIPENALGRDSIVMQHHLKPDLIRKRYRNLLPKQLDLYYNILQAFISRLPTHVHGYRLLYTRKKELFLFKHTSVQTISPVRNDYLYDRGFYGVEVPYIRGNMVADEKINEQLDYLFTCFVEKTWSKEVARELFFPFKKQDTALKIFQYPNLRKMDDGTIVLLDVNRIQHLVKTLDR